MTEKQKNILSIFVLLNLIVYGFLAFFAFVILPEQDRARAEANEIALQQILTALTPTPALTTLVQTLPAASPPDQLTSRPTDQPTIRPTDPPPTTPFPWQEGGSWWATAQPTTVAISLTNTPLPWQEGGIWWATPSPAAAAKPAVIVGSTPALKPAAQQIIAQASATLQTAAAAPSGDSPANAITPGDSWRLINPGASVWYKIGKGGDHMDVFVDANPLQGMAMAIFAPDNLDRPIGQGSLEKGRLVWSGGKWNSGSDWVARVTNNNSSPVSYRFISSTREIGTCDSYSYWEYIGKNLVYWTACH